MLTLDQNGLRERKVLTNGHGHSKRLLSDEALEGLANYDVFPKVADDFKERTTSGGTVSVCVFIVMFLFFLTELYYFLFVTTIHYSYEVDREFNRRLRLNLDMVIASPCSSIGADVIDRTKTHLSSGASGGPSQAGVNARQMIDEKSLKSYEFEKEEEKTNWERWSQFYRNVRRSYHTVHDLFWQQSVDLKVDDTKMDLAFDDEKKFMARAKGATSERDVYVDDDEIGRSDKDRQKQQQRGPMGVGFVINLGVMGGANGDGACRLNGTFVINKIGGTLHIIAGKAMPGFPFGGHVHMQFGMQHGGQNFSHRIQHFSFGTPVRGIMRPLDGEEKLDNTLRSAFFYFIQIVPTEVKSLHGEAIETYQFAVTERQLNISHSEGTHGSPGIFVEYDFSPLVVKVEARRSSTLRQFAVRCFGILGGFYSCVAICHKCLAAMLSMFKPTPVLLTE